MWRYILRRLLYIIPMMLGVSVLTFFVMKLAPGDYLDLLRLNPDVSPEAIEQLNRQFGLDQPAYVQFGRWLWNVLHFNLGHSFNYGAPVSYLIGTRLLNTLLLSVASLALAWTFSFPAGVYAAVKAHSTYDRVLTFAAFIGLSIPNYFLALLLLYLVVHFNLPLPVGGMTSSDFASLSTWGKVADIGRHLIVPAVVLGTASMASLTRYLRSGMLDVLGQEYVVTARAKGLPESRVVWKHGVRNALNVMITIFGFELGSLLNGAALTEIITGWPGMGRLVLEALRAYDYYVVMGTVLMAGVLLVVGNLVADILLAWADPRVRLQ
ncbi:MAG: ABC transporter permease [Bacillota bacterium]